MMNESIMHQRNETNEAKRKTSSAISHRTTTTTTNIKNRHRQRTQRKESARRASSHGLPSLATNTVQMVVATMQLGTTKINSIDDNDQQEQDERILNIGQDLQAHLPDIVLENLNEFIDNQGQICIPNEHTYNNGTLLFLDVSGFTSLTEQYSNDAHLGIDQLTRTLNCYFHKVVSEILKHDGDIYKFAGDAILALWTDEQIGAQRALNCALQLQRKCGAYETDVGVTLRLKVALAYGPVRAHFVGIEEFKHYLLTGDCVTSVNRCEQLCEAGDIILTRRVYDKLPLNSFDCQFLPLNEEINSVESHFLVKYETTSMEIEENSANNVERTDMTNSNDDISSIEFNDKIHSLMKSFLLHCVYQRIERKQSLDYLSELRRVTISFINLDISNEQTINANLHLNLQKIFVHIYELTKMLGGVLTKALLFDKGWSFLCVFGLPGYKQGDDTANALKSAQMIHSTIRNQCDFVEQCSIGVTTGLTYCGVVGHVLRCEYTVIGRKVNMAARLMCNYPNIISCDQETFYNSRLNSRFFQLLPTKVLKGMNNIGLIWHYGDNHDLSPMIESKEHNQMTNPQINDIRHEDYPLLGRRVELMIVAAQLCLLDEPLDSPKRRRELAAIIFEGDDKIGRSRLLQFITSSLENSNHSHSPSLIAHYDNSYIPNDLIVSRTTPALMTDDNSQCMTSSLNAYAMDCSTVKKPLIQVINYRCQFEQRFIELGLLRSLLRQLLQFHSNDKTHMEREQYLLRLFDINNSHDLHLRRNLFLLNDLLDVRFRRSCLDKDSINETNLVQKFENNLNELILHILNKLIDSSNQIANSYNTAPNGNSLQLTNSIASQYQVSLDSNTSATSSTTICTVSKIIFVIDDIHFADESSLKHLLTLGSHRKSLLILSMKPPTNNNNDRPNSNTLQSIRTDSRVYLRRLPGLELRYLATLGCQILSVCRIPTKLVKVFNECCNGIPGFCEQILLDLLSKDKIYISDQSDTTDKEDETMSEGDPDKLLLNTSNRLGLLKTFFSQRKRTISAEQSLEHRVFHRQCFLRNPDENDFNADCEQNFQNYIMCRIDRLSEGESLLVKIAAVIGNTFSRMFLWHLVDAPSKKLININSCILDMMERTVIECAHAKEQQKTTRSIKCFCLQNPGGFPSQCRLMAFTHSTIREGIYNSLPDSLKRLLIRNAIDYLEKQSAIACLTCAANRYDSPFLVHDQDGLAKSIKNKQQHAFEDIVRMAALKEIDNAIKQLTRLNESGIQPSTPTFIIPMDDENFSGNTDSDHRRLERDLSNNTSAGLSFEEELTDENVHVKIHDNSHRNSSEPNLTLISVYSSDAMPKVQVNVQRSTSTVSAHPSQLISLFKLPKRTSRDDSTSNTQLLQSIDGIVKDDHRSKNEAIVDSSKMTKTKKRYRFLAFIRYMFCQFIPVTANATVTPADEPENIDEARLSLNTNQVSSSATIISLEQPTKENAIPLKATSHWRKVRKAVLPAPGKSFQTFPTEHELLEKSLFSPELMSNFANDLKFLKNRSHLNRTFENLYNQSLVFYTFQSYAQHYQLFQSISDRNQVDETPIDLNQFASQLRSSNDIRVCECADYLLTVYIKLVEYHSHLYDMYEKMPEEKRDHLRLKQFDRIMYYRIEICQLLLNCHCDQRLLVEIENGRKFGEKFREDTANQDDFLYQYQYLLVELRYNLFHANVLYRTRAMNDAKQLVEQNLRQLNRMYDEKIWERCQNLPDTSNCPLAKEKRIQYEQSKESSAESSPSSTNSISDPFFIHNGKYRLEYLLCQYHLFDYQLCRQSSSNSIGILLDLQYHTFPFTFSLPCTIVLVEYFYSQMNYSQCLMLIEKFIQFWWPFLSSREKLELAKLKCFSLIIELKRGQVDSAILSGFFAKSLLSVFHENTFLIQSCIYLTFALIGQMRISPIELTLHHLEYLSEQTMNCNAKFWYYILVIDVALELGYEFLPINMEFLGYISKYRKKLRSGSNQRSLLLIYSDCVLGQIYARLGQIDMSKIHFHQACCQFQIEAMHLDPSDFRFKRALLKLAEIQLIHWFYSNDDLEMTSSKDYFLLHYFNQLNNEEFLAWNKTRYFIYQAYYDRLINDYRREKSLPIDNDFDWRKTLDRAEKNAIKLDEEWIKQLRRAWSHSRVEQVLLSRQQSISHHHLSSNRFPVQQTKQSNRRCWRLSRGQLKSSTKNENQRDDFLDEQIPVNIEHHSQQKFLDWRLALNQHHHHGLFQLFVLPVKI